MKAGIPQESVIGQLFFLVYVNGLSEKIISTVKLFGDDKNKQAQEVVFSRKQSKPKHPQLLFNKTPVVYFPSKKHLGRILDGKLSFTNYIKVKIQKAGIAINVIKSINDILPRQVLLAIYK